MAPTFELPSWLLDYCVKTEDDIKSRPLLVTVEKAASKEDSKGDGKEDGKKDGKEDKTNAPADTPTDTPTKEQKSEPAYRISPAKYAKLKNTVAATLVSGTQIDVLDQRFAIFLRTQAFSEGLDLLVAHLAADFGASTCSLDADDLYELARNFDSPSKGLLEKDSESDDDQLQSIKNLRVPSLAIQKYFADFSNSKKAVAALLGAPSQKMAKQQASERPASDLDNSSQKEADIEEKSSEETEETTKGVTTKENPEGNATITDAKDLPAGPNAEGTNSEEDEAEASKDDDSISLISTPEQSEPDAATEGAAGEKESDEGKSTPSCPTESTGDAEGMLPVGTQPFFLHLRNANKLADESGDFDEAVLQTLHDTIAVFRRQKHKIVLFVSATTTGNKPTSGCRYSCCTNEWMKKITKAIGIDSSMAVNIESPLLVLKDCETLIQTQLTRNANISALQKRLSQRLQLSESSLLHPSNQWSFLDEYKALKYMGTFLLADTILEQAARLIAGRTLSGFKLEAEDIVAVLKSLRKSAEKTRDSDRDSASSDSDEKLDNDEDDDGDSDSESESKEEEKDNEGKKEGEDEDNEEKESALKKLLDGIRCDCDQYESQLMDHIVDPDKLNTGYDDVIVDDATKAAVKQLIALSKFQPKGKSGKTEKPAKKSLLEQVRLNGALFYGPPGTGKTHLARAIAKESGANMLSLDAAALQSKWVGETEKLIRAAFTLAAKLYPCVLFIDEVDSLFRQRAATDKRWERQALNQYLGEMDGLGSNAKAPFVIVATNRPSDLDDAFLRRLPHKVLFRLPGFDERVRILRCFLDDESLHLDVSVDELAQVTEGFSGSDLRTLCGQATLAWSLEEAYKQQAVEKEKAAKKEAAEKEEAAKKQEAAEAEKTVGEAEASKETAEEDKTVTEKKDDEKKDAADKEKTKKEEESEKKEESKENEADGKKAKEAEEETVDLTPVLTNSHFETALQNTCATVTRASLRVLEDFARQFSSNPKLKPGLSLSGRRLGTAQSS